MGPSGEPTGLCIPSDLSKFVSVSASSISALHAVSKTLLTSLWSSSFKIPPWSPPEIQRPASLDLVASTSVLELAVMTAIAKLSNHVQANVSFRALAK